MSFVSRQRREALVVLSRSRRSRPDDYESAKSLHRSVLSRRVRPCAWTGTARDGPLLFPTVPQWVHRCRRILRKSLPKNGHLCFPSAIVQWHPSSSFLSEDGRTDDVRVKDYPGRPEESCRVFAGESAPVRARVPQPRRQIPPEPPPRLRLRLDLIRLMS